METMRERETAPALLYELLGRERLAQSRRERIRQENGQLRERGFRLYARMVQILAVHGGRQGITPPVKVNLDGYGPVELTIAHSFSSETNSICDGAVIQISQNGRAEKLIRVFHWGKVEKQQEEVMPEELTKIEETVDFIESSLKI